MVIGRSQEGNRAAALRLRDGRVMAGDFEHHGDAGGVVERAFEEGVGVRHHQDVLVSRAR